MKENYDDDDEELEENEDDYSPTSWEQQPGESDEDYEDRRQDLEDWFEHDD